MATTSNGFGFIATRHLDGGTVRTKAIGSRTQVWNGIAPTNTNTLFVGQVVLLNSSGQIDRATAGATNTYGIFAGCEYDDSSGRHIVGYWPGTASATNIVAWVFVDPKIVFQVQADATAATTNVGENFNVSATQINSSISTATQRSSAMLGISTSTTSAAQFQLIGLADRPDNAWADAFPVLEVTLNGVVDNASYSGI